MDGRQLPGARHRSRFQVPRSGPGRVWGEVEAGGELKLVEQQVAQEEKLAESGRSSADKLLSAKRSLLSLRRQLAAFDERTKRPDPADIEGRKREAEEQKKVAEEQARQVAASKAEMAAVLLDIARKDTDAFNRVLTAFAAIRAPALDLVIHEGPEENTFLKSGDKPDTSARVDWTFTVWVPANWHRLYNNPKSVFAAEQPSFRQPVDPPRLDVYLGGGQVDWSKVTVPGQLRVRDERAAAAGIPPALGSVARVDVFDMMTGRPVRGARLLAAKWSPQGGCQPVAEATGGDTDWVEITKLPSGTLRLVVEATGYAPRRVGYERFGEHTFKLFAAALARQASVRGQVTDSEGKPVAGAKVGASSVMALDGRGYPGFDAPEAETDRVGQFELAPLPTGFAQLRVNAVGYHFGDLFAIHDVPATNLLLRLSRAGSIRVILTDQSSIAISRFGGNELIVEAEPEGGSKAGSRGGSATVKDDGTFEFQTVPSGTYRISSRPNPATTNHRYAADQIVEVKPGEPIEVKVVYE